MGPMSDPSAGRRQREKLRQLTLEFSDLPELPPLPKGAPDHAALKVLPARRSGMTFEARIGSTKVFVSTGEYADGSLGEIFVDIAKEGSSVRGFVNVFAIAFSQAIQHGTSLQTLVDTFLYCRFDPAGMVTGHPQILWASSIPDYIAKLLAVEYLGDERVFTEHGAREREFLTDPSESPPAG